MKNYGKLKETGVFGFSTHNLTLLDTPLDQSRFA